MIGYIENEFIISHALYFISPNSLTDNEEAGADIVRSRTTSDLTHVTTSTTANKYQYLMKVNINLIVLF